MLRSLIPHEEPELMRLCRMKNWMKVSERAESHRGEATPSERCLRGEGETVLSLAVRLGAPVSAVHALYKANIHQIGITHRSRGSILHEALTRHASHDVFDFLLQRTIDYQSTHRGHDNKTFQGWPDPPIFSHIIIQDSRFIRGPNLLGVADERGRTALHYVVEHATKPHSVVHELDQRKATVDHFRTIVNAFPAAIDVMDVDGNSPLILLLLTPRRGSSATEQLDTETVVFRMAQLILALYPGAATVSRKKTQRAYLLASSSNCYPRRNDDSSPLYFALLHGRSIETIQLLLNVSRALGVKSAARIVGPDREVSLHIAITTRAPLKIVLALHQDCPGAVTTSDVYGLTPIDWLWIRHVLDWYANPTDFTSVRVISRRRYIATQFLDWSASSSSARHESSSPSASPVSRSRSPLSPLTAVTIRRLQEDLFQRIRVLLPAAAAAAAAANSGSYGENSDDWTLLHAACFVHCPIGMVRLALAMDKDAFDSLRQRDRRAGRHPLHYAAGRVGYSAKVPVGVLRGIEILREAAPIHDILPCFPEACRVRDSAGQLPIHIAIDTAKQHRTNAGAREADDYDATELDILNALLHYCPSTLEFRDSKTSLFPWQQAAVGNGTSLNTIFELLRRHPTLTIS